MRRWDGCIGQHLIIKQTGTNKNVITIQSGAILSLCDCKPDEAHTGLAVDISGLTGGLITGGSLIYNNETSAIHGGGICNQGTLNMYGGTIAGNTSHSNEAESSNIYYSKGGGVYSSNTFNMYGGLITKNTSTGLSMNAGMGAGVFSTRIFNMYGGMIKNNSAKHAGSGIYNTGTFNLHDGVVTSNTTSEAIYNAGTIIMNGGEISNHTKGGIFNSGWGNLTINGGSIKDNSCVSDTGGGIYNAGTLTLNGGIISGNKAMKGGGVLNRSSFTLTGGSITGNTSTNGGGGIYVVSYKDTQLKFSGDVCIEDNHVGSSISNVYFEVGKDGSLSSAQVTSNLDTTARIGLSVANQLTDTVLVTADDASYFSALNFSSDVANYHIEVIDSTKLVLKTGAAALHKHDDNTVFWALSTISGPLSSGSYYLTGDITLSDTVTISGSVNLCLNGHTITGPADKPAFQVPGGAALNIYNEEGADNFAGLSGSGGIEVAGGGSLNLVAKNAAGNVTYAPAAGTGGGTVTVSQDGTVTKPGGGGDESAPGTGDHKADHPDPTGSFTAINAGNFASVTQAEKPSDYTGALPAVTTAYRFLNSGKYYLENDFKMPYALIVLGNTDFCLNGSNLGADNDTWIYEMQHVFWVPEQAALNVLDCQRDLHIVWLYGGRVFLKNGARVNISGKLPGYITTIEMDGAAEGEVKVEYVNKEPVMTLPKGATLTQKAPGKPDQMITNHDGVLETTTSGAGAPAIKITPPSTGTSINLKLPETVSSEETPDIVLEAPAGSTVRTGNGPEIKLEQPGEVASDGTVSSPEVTVITVDPVTKEEVKTTVTAPAGGNVKADPADGTVEAPAGSMVTAGGETVKIEEIRQTTGGAAADTVTVRPGGQIELPAGEEVTISSSKRGSATIVIALPGGADPGTINITDTGVTLPKGSTVTVKPKRESVTIVIALPYPEDGSEPPEIRFSDNGALILPEGTEVTTRNGDQETKATVTEDAPYLNPETGELTEADPGAPTQPSKPVHPNEPVGKTEEITPGTPIIKPDVKVEMDDKGEITVTPADPEKPSVVIKPQPQDPDKPGETPAPPVVDETGKVFIDAPFKVETEDGPDITAGKGGSVDPDGNVIGETVTVEQKKPDGTTESTTLTAPENDAIKVGPNGEAQAPAGTEIERDDVKVKIDKVPDPTKPVLIKPDGSLDLPGGSEITVTPEQPQLPDQNYTVTIPEQGGEVKLDQDEAVIILPPGAKVVDQNGKETTISSGGGTIDLSTGEITGGSDNHGPGSGSGGSGGGSSSSTSYIIMASASIGGEISPEKRVTVRSGADQTFTIRPAEGYVISDVLVDGKSVGQVTSYTFRNVRSGHTIQALFVAEGMSGHGHQGDCPKDETCPIWPYTDSIPTDWYHDGVHYCIEDQLMIGTAPVLWEPDISLSRAMMAQVLYNKAGQPAVSGDGVFDDVDREWYWPAITWGGRNNVLLGYDDGSYGPQDPITREQLATLLWRYAGQPQTDDQLRFSDAAEVSDYARQALNWASRQGVITGYPDGTFRPQDDASRAEAAQMIMRYFEL